MPITGGRVQISLQRGRHLRHSVHQHRLGYPNLAAVRSAVHFSARIALTWTCQIILECDAAVVDVHLCARCDEVRHQRFWLQNANSIALQIRMFGEAYSYVYIK